MTHGYDNDVRKRSITTLFAAAVTLCSNFELYNVIIATELCYLIIGHLIGKAGDKIENKLHKV